MPSQGLVCRRKAQPGVRGSAWRGSPEQPVFQGRGGWEKEPGCRGCRSKGSEAWGTGEPSSSLVWRTLGAWKSLLLLWGQASRWPFPAGSIVDRTQSHLWSAGWDPGHSPTHMHPATELPAPPWQPSRSTVLGAVAATILSPTGYMYAGKAACFRNGFF